MPVHADDSGNRWVEMEYVVPGTPEQVWDAVATGPGMRAWFAKVDVDEREGGRIEFHFGPDTTTSGPITVWEPPVRFGYEEHGWNGDAPVIATEITVRARSGGECVVRMVHTMTTDSEDWDGELESFEKGWPGFFDVLRIYLRDYAGRPAAIAGAMAPLEIDVARSWSALMTALNLHGADVGDRREAPTGGPELGGRVAITHQDTDNRYVLVRLDAPHDGVAVIGVCDGGDGRGMASASLYFYGEGVDRVAAEQDEVWTAWLPDRVRTLS
ncbi:SRPBCC family protein [Mycolicibacterium arenosum]|uniref:SRPBCC domain-containing protein n=1 Tax=Mycolicibacterium arenosum TaxID=2952157 RepID=A0ABT1LZ89_9MYCO|nr:SRPBCC domain-containing protein [Mycolicibacterium sp. CAU 1645]MCP9272218.1 SRPBCC domain-containing protein [Mycolicibacterium sp. CAU 1645]